MIDSVVGTLIGVIIGGLITWVVARIYKDLSQEADALRRVNFFLLRALVKTGQVELVPDENGLPHKYKISDEYGGATIYVADERRQIVTTARGRPMSGPVPDHMHNK